MTFRCTTTWPSALKPSSLKQEQSQRDDDSSHTSMTADTAHSNLSSSSSWSCIHEQQQQQQQPNKRRQARVAFDLHSTVYREASHALHERDVANDLWYTKSDFQFMKSWNRMTVKLFKQRQRMSSSSVDIDIVSDDQDYCVRGLEHKLANQLAFRRQLRTASIYAVLKEQTRLRKASEDDHDEYCTVLSSSNHDAVHLSRAYQRAIPPTHIHNCQQRALEDQHDAFLYLRPSVEDAPSRAGRRSTRRRSSQIVPLIDSSVLEELNAQCACDDDDDEQEADEGDSSHANAAADANSNEDEDSDSDADDNATVDSLFLRMSME